MIPLTISKMTLDRPKLNEQKNSLSLYILSPLSGVGAKTICPATFTFGKVYFLTVKSLSVANLKMF